MKLKLIKAPITLSEYFVTKLTFEQEPSFTPPPDNSLIIHSSIDTSFEVSKSEANPLKWKAKMSIASTKADRGKLPYNFSICVEALLDVDPEYPAEEQALLVNITGNSLVYGVCREKVRQVCSHGKYKPVLIPAVRFICESEPVEKTEGPPKT
jgi:preprotein translocase subunit SecB